MNIVSPRIAALLAMLLAVAGFASAAVGYAVYEGSLATFVAFSLVYASILAVAILHPRQYAHLFLAAMWFVGFWVKFVLHELIKWTYVEPVGAFQDTPASKDAVLLVCAIGGAAFLAGRLVGLQMSEYLRQSFSERDYAVPGWYCAVRRPLWMISTLIVLLVVYLNWQFGILSRGFVPRMSLPWPLGGLFGWIMDIGMALVMSILLAWDRRTGRDVLKGFFLLCVEGATMSISTLSRALYIFHTLPFFIADPVRSVGRRTWRLGAAAFVWLAVAAAVPAITTFERIYGASAVPVHAPELDQGFDKRRYDANELKWQAIGFVQLLAIERWTGLEGVMSTESYTGKSFDLFAHAATARRSYGTVDVYTRDISKSGFSERHAQTYHFASPAGPIAFLYFSGSLWVVILGMALLAIIVSAIEGLWTWLIRDPLPLAISGWYLAFIVLQLSGGLQQAITGPVMVTLLFAVARVACLQGKRA